MKKSKEEWYEEISEEIVRITINTENSKPYIKLDIYLEKWRTPQQYVDFLKKVEEMITKKFL